jgi:hypothetical protein
VRITPTIRTQLQVPARGCLPTVPSPTRFPRAQHRACQNLSMSDLFNYVPHPHIELRKLKGPTKVRDVAMSVHGDNAIGRLNAKVGLRITVIVGTMWAAYVFAAIAFISLPDNVHSTQLLILWISSSFLQLVLLPVIIVGQNIQANASDKRAEATFNDAAAVLEEAKQIQAHLLAQDEAISKILASVAAGAATASEPSPRGDEPVA